MIRSDYDMYAEDAAVVASGQVGNVLNHGEPRTGYDAEGIGSGAVQRWLNIVVKTDFSESTSQQFVLETSAAEGMGDPVTLAITPVIPVAELTKGAHFTVPIASGGLQYSRVRSIGAGTTEASGEVDIFTTY